MTGAGGYVGSVVVERFVQRTEQVVGVDDLSHGHRDAVHPGAFRAPRPARRRFPQRLVLAERPDAVIHLAAESLVGRSLVDPGAFFRVNAQGGLNLLEAMARSGTKRIVYSSTAAVYGEPRDVPIAEEAPLRPVNPYGESKLAFERMLFWYRQSYGIEYVTLRYFNVCGASERYGELHVPETHLVPILLEVVLGLRGEVRLYGTDYETPDGTCIRDYVHVSDIADAHVLALDDIERASGRAYNVGIGRGYSNLEVIATFHQVTKRAIKVVPVARRPGDPARLIADADRVRRELGWRPQFDELKSMVETALRWRMRHRRGYEV